MQPLSEQASVDEVVVTGPRRSRASRYSIYNGAGRNPELAEPPERLRQRPRNPADVAQSALFATLLIEEIDELEDRTAAAERRWQRRCERSPDEVVILPIEVTELRRRLAEAQRMLDALRKRFPPA